MFLWRLVALFVILVVLIFSTGMLVARFVWGGDLFDQKTGGHPPAWEIGLGLLLLLLIGAFIFRTMRRTAAPIADIMGAADRVARGDYSVRVHACGSKEVRRLGSSFNQMVTRLQADEEQRRHLLADIAHELRTPLSVIRGNLEGMLDGVYPRDDAHLEPVLEETVVMARLLDDLRTLSLAETGTLRLYPEQTCIRELVEDTVAAFRPRCAAAGISLEGRVGDLPDAEIDPVRIRQVLENLLMNALRYTPHGGSIRIDACAERDRLRITVSDTGQGIPPEELPHIFDRFTKSADSGGSGLGLAIAKRLVEAHGGTIQAESTHGQGTSIVMSMSLNGAAQQGI